MSIYSLVSGVNKEFKEHYSLSSGTNKKITEIYGVAGGVNKKVYTSQQKILIPNFSTTTGNPGADRTFYYPAPVFQNINKFSLQLKLYHIRTPGVKSGYIIFRFNNGKELIIKNEINILRDEDGFLENVYNQFSYLYGGYSLLVLSKPVSSSPSQNFIFDANNGKFIIDGVNYDISSVMINDKPFNLAEIAIDRWSGTMLDVVCTNIQIE